MKINLLNIRLGLSRCIRCLALVIALGLSIVSASAQITGGGSGGLDLDKLMGGSQLAKPGADVSKLADIPFDRAIDPSTYLVGPGDMLGFQVLNWSLNENLMVSPDNGLLIPRLGYFNVKGLSLQQVRDTILATLRSRVSDGIGALTLVRPRSVYVSVRGNIKFPGTYIFPASLRVSTAVQLCNQEASPDQSKKQNISKEDPLKDKRLEDSRLGPSGLPSNVARNIALSRGDGSILTIDMEQSRLGVGQAEPYLREGDEIYVPFETQQHPVIIASGAVRKPGEFAFRSGDKASFLLALAGGLQQDADPDQIYLATSSGATQKIVVSPDGRVLGSDPLLKPGDALVAVARTHVGARSSGFVELVGNVTSPGVFAIVPGKTRLKDVIEKAGGFTDEAYLPLATITRRLAPGQKPLSDRLVFNQMLAHSHLVAEDTSRYFLHGSALKPTVSCDFEAAFKESSATDNVLMEDGDIINVPADPKRVFVFGQVNKPGYITHQSNRSMDWYIRQAGGFAEGAEPGLARIVRGKNFIWVQGDDSAPVFSGDYIYVPPPTQKMQGLDLQFYGLLATAISSGVFLIVTLINLFRN